MKADTKQVNRLLKTAQGQITGVLAMIEKDAYCIDIVNQIMASTAILQKASNEILKAHMNQCVQDAFVAQDEEEINSKINELIVILDKLQK